MNKKLILLIFLLIAIVVVYLRQCRTMVNCNYQSFYNARSMEDSLKIYTANFEQFFDCFGTSQNLTPIKVTVKELPPWFPDNPRCPPPMCREFLEKIAVTNSIEDTLLIYNHYNQLGDHVIVCPPVAVDDSGLLGFYKFSIPASPKNYSNPIKMEIKSRGGTTKNVYIMIENK